MRRLLLIALLGITARAWAAAPFATELLTVSAAPVGITANLCRVGGSAAGASGGAIVEVVSGTINYLLHDPAATPDATAHKLSAGEVLTLAEPYKFRAVRNGVDATVRVTCVDSIQQTQILKTSSVTAAGDGKILDGNGPGEADVIGANPVGTEQGLVVRPIPSGTQNISAVSLPLPTGAATSANQSTTNTSLSSIDGKLPAPVAGRVPVDGSGVTQPVSGTITANAGAGTFSNQQSNKTADFDTGAGTDTVTMFGVALPKSGGAVAGGTSTDPLRIDPTGTTTQPISGTVTANQGGSNWSTNVAQINGATPLMGSGNTGTGSPRVTIATDQPTLSNTLANVGIVPITAGGAAPCYVSSSASTNATSCKASAGQVYGYEVINTTSTIYYLRMYNLAAAPTCSLATGFVRSIPIPHALGNGGGVSFSQAVGEAFGTGIAFCLTGGGSSTDNTNAAAGVYITVLYK